MTFYENIQSCVINNGITSNYFTIERRHRQGDHSRSLHISLWWLLKPWLLVRQNSKMKGITIDNWKKRSYPNMQMTQRQFSRTLTQLKLSSCSTISRSSQVNLTKPVNLTKTEGMWIGSLWENKSTPFGIKWTNEPVKALGVYYSYDQQLLHEKNFIERLDSVKKLLQKVSPLMER